MTPLKDTLDVGEVSASQAAHRPKPDSGQLRSDAVSLDVPVKVHGSRVVEVVRGTTQHTEPFEEQTSTMIVFPLGGVLKMTTQVSVGQAIVLTNLKTNQDAICRVVKTRTNPNLHCYVEVEFSHPQPGYWGVRFSSDAPEPPKKAPSPAAGAPVAATLVAKAPAAPVVSAPAPKVEISKTQIKEQETAPAIRPAPVTPAAPPRVAAPIEIAKHVAPVAPPLAKPAAETPAPAFASDASSFSLDQLRGDSVAAPVKPLPSAAQAEDAGGEQTSVKDEPAARETPTFGRYAAAAAPSADHAARPAFGAGLEYNPLGAVAEKGQKHGKNWAPIAVCAVLLSAAAGAGGFYFVHKKPMAGHVAAAVPSIPQSPIAANEAANPAPVAPAPVQQTSAEAAPPASAPSAPAAASPVARLRQAEPDKASKAAKSEQALSPVQSRNAESAKQKPAPAVPDMFGALNAHPTAGIHTGTAQTGAAPSIDAGAVAGGQSAALPSIESSPANVAPPPPPPPPQQSAPQGPVMVGGDVKPPKTVSAVPVEYPEIARQAGVQGSVVVRIVIDKAGNVTDARALSGPALLRDAAVRALRQRKYAPSKLNGNPISVVMLVTIQFRP